MALKISIQRDGLKGLKFLTVQSVDPMHDGTKLWRVGLRDTLGDREGHLTVSLPGGREAMKITIVDGDIAAILMEGDIPWSYNVLMGVDGCFGPCTYIDGEDGTGWKAELYDGLNPPVAGPKGRS